MISETILIIGANGQLGSVLTKELQKIYGKKNVIASDIFLDTDFDGIFEVIDATDLNAIKAIINKYSIKEIYHLAAILSAKGEEKPLSTWDLNIKMMLNVFEVSRLNNVKKIFFPSSIAVFGDQAPLLDTPQSTLLNPATVYGISKAAGENWAQYYFTKYGLDIRSIRFPGIIGYQSMPGGGTTDYAVSIYHSAVKNENFSCFLNSDTKLPMMFMSDAIRSTIELMQSPIENIKIRTSYNIAGMSFSPNEIYNEIKKSYPNFKIEYNSDFRQKIADKWPKNIDDKKAKNDWGWKPEHNLSSMTLIMLKKLKEKYNKPV